MKDFVVVIPARYQSSRLPGKPLIDILGKSLIERTYNQVNKAISNDLIYVATDDHRIQKHCEELKINVVMTSSNCLTGTDRIAEFSKHINAKTYINVQGDEPIINPEDVLKIIKTAQHNPDGIINGYAPITSEKQYRSLSIPKVVFTADGRLLYMSRSPIPGNKKNEFQKAWRQICVYAFPKQSLVDFSSENQKTNLENEEDIEILRFIELGYEVRMIKLSDNSLAVDTPEDVEIAKKILTKDNL